MARAAMGDRDLRLIHPVPPPERRAAVPNVVLGTMVFILTEAMFFAGFISAYAINRTAASVWPPPDQPRLPIEATGVNTVVLLLSAAALWYAGRAHARDARAARWPTLAALAMGVFFVVFQGVEWSHLLGLGMTLTATTYGSFFFLIVGAHAVHVVFAVIVLGALTVRLFQGTLTQDAFWAGRLYWYFVVLLWPVLYWRVYLT